MFRTHWHWIIWYQGDRVIILADLWQTLSVSRRVAFTWWTTTTLAWIPVNFLPCQPGAWAMNTGVPSFHSAAVARLEEVISTFNFENSIFVIAAHQLISYCTYDISWKTYRSTWMLWADSIGSPVNEEWNGRENMFLQTCFMAPIVLFSLNWGINMMMSLSWGPAVCGLYRRCDNWWRVGPWFIKRRRGHASMSIHLYKNCPYFRYNGMYAFIATWRKLQQRPNRVVRPL